MQHLVVGGSRVPSVDDSWIINGAGRHVSHNFGFGLVDCGMLVQLAETWQPVTAQHTRIYHRHIQRSVSSAPCRIVVPIYAFSGSVLGITGTN